MAEEMNKRKTGAVYEAKAASYLKENGYQILEKNYRCPLGEIDLIAREGRYLVFIEVKYRRTSRLGTGEEAVNIRKQQKILAASRWYLMQHPAWCYCRFDVVAIHGEMIHVIRNAFECR